MSRYHPDIDIVLNEHYKIVGHFGNFELQYREGDTIRPVTRFHGNLESIARLILKNEFADKKASTIEELICVVQKLNETMEKVYGEVRRIQNDTGTMDPSSLSV